MKTPRFLAFHVSLIALLAANAQADDSTITTPSTTPSPPIVDYQVTAKKLDQAQNGLSTETGTSSYHFNQENITDLPMGDQTSFNQVLLQAPGVTQDSYGQLHVREDHDNLQYRIDGILIPEGISGFGQTLDTHYTDQLNLLTGALPAQYGFRTAGIIDLTTKSGAFANGGRSEITVGSHDTFEGTQEFYGSKDGFNYYINAGYDYNKLGIESPTSSANPIHDGTHQDRMFGYFSYVLNSDARIKVIMANAVNDFQIPDNPGQTPLFTVNGATDTSANLHETQNEQNTYGIVALQGSTESNIDYQFALFSRYSDTDYRPDNLGDLVFTGVAGYINNSSLVNGLQGDASYQLNDTHTLRSGFYISNEEARSNTDTSVFATDGNGNVISSNPFSIQNNTSKAAQLYDVYLQDEWKAMDKLTINYGARFDVSDAYVDASQLSPRIGAVYDLTSSTKLHAGYARYFTPPPTELVATTAITKFNNTTNQPEVETNSPVEPERTNYYDVGINHQLTSHINLGLDGYYKDIHDLIDEGQFGSALIFTPFNYTKGRAYGTEFTSEYHQDNFKAYLNVTAERAVGTDIASDQYLFSQAQLDFIANHYIHLDHDQTFTTSAGISYKLDETTYSADAINGSGLRNGFANTTHLPDYTQVNLSVAHVFNTPTTGEFDTRFSILNLFDEVYEIRDGSGVGVTAPQYGPRRAFYVTVGKSF